MTSILQINNKFSDVKPWLDQALASGGGVFQAPSHGQAVRFRHRCYTFRKAYAEAVAPAASPYDRLTLRKLRKEDSKVIIEVLQFEGTFTPLEGGTPVATPSFEGAAVPTSSTEDLEDEAAALRFKLGLE